MQYVKSLDEYQSLNQLEFLNKKAERIIRTNHINLDKHSFLVIFSLFKMEMSFEEKI